MENNSRLNFWLLLKQGFKSIFKFRAQFIIILILSFLATLILTISISTSRRLESAYNRVVKKVDPFDFMGTTKIAKSATVNAGGADINAFRSVGLMDFINNTFVNGINDLDEENISNNSSYNFIFNSQAYENLFQSKAQNFMTKVIDSQEDTGFYQLTKSFYDPSEDFTRSDWEWNLKDAFALQLVNDLMAYRDDQNNEEVSYLTNTSFALMLKNNSNFLNFLGKKFIKSDFYGFNLDQQRFIRYIYWISAQIVSWISDQEAEFASVKTGETGIFDDAQVTSVDDKTEVFYEFITGKVFLGNAIKQEKFIIHDQTDTYVLETKYYQEWDSDVNENKYLMVEQENSDKAKTSALESQQIEALRQKGYRGITSPLTIKVGAISYLPGKGELDSPYTGIKDISFMQNYEEFALLNPKRVVPLIRDLSLDEDFNLRYDIMSRETNDWNPNLSTSTKAAMMQYHIEFNSLSAGFNVRFRKESVVFDNISSRKFRFVVLNARDNANFTILRGTEPSASNEVAISEQFARVNKIKLGQYLTIGQGLVMVTGFAADAFTFFPNADPDFPVPQPKTETVVYGSIETLLKIQEGNGEGTSNQNTNPQMFSFFLTNNKSQNLYNLTTKRNLFISLQMDLATNLKDNFNFISNLKENVSSSQNKDFSLIKKQDISFSQNQNLDSNVGSFFSLKNFKDSNYRFSWTLLPSVLKTFDIITFVASFIIAIIAIIALVICIRKTITFNAKQIGILKALGTNPWMVSVTYLAHSLVIIGVVIPLGWILGTFLQIPFAMLFTQYFSAQSNIVLVDWISLVIALFGFGISALGISIIAAYLVTEKPVMQIISYSVKWSNSKIIDKLKETIFKNTSFHYRFSLTLSSSGKKPIILLVTVVGLTSLLISAAIAIPAVANKAVVSYYKSVKYANAYDNMVPTVNSPLSKTALNFWKGNEKWDSNWRNSDLKLDSTDTKYGYYLDPEGYMDSASQASPIPKYVYFKDLGADQNDIVQNFTYAYAYLLKNPAMFLNLASEAFGDNYFTVLGQTFNIGTIDQFFGLILNANYETIREFMGGHYDDTLKKWVGGYYDESLSLDANKQKLAIKFSSSLTMALPNIISVVTSATRGGSINGSTGEGEDWKQDIINVILKEVPPYIKTYIQKSPSRLEQFGISFNAESYTPKKETFVTAFSAQTDEFNNVKFVGVDKNQNAYVVKEEDDDHLYLSSEDLAKVQKILDGQGNQVQSFAVNGLTIWDGYNLNLPMLDNRQSKVGYQLGEDGMLTNISTTTRQLKFRSNDRTNPWQVLPKNAWAYDDSDFWKSNLFKDPKNTLNLNTNLNALDYQEAVENNNAVNPENSVDNQQSSWLDAYAIENSKFTYNQIFDENNQLNDKTFFFNDFAFDQNQQLKSSYIRPYYQYKNIKLFLPTAVINEDDILKSSSNSSVTTGWYEKVNANDQREKVPTSVLNAWGLKREDNPEFLVINPYDLSYGQKNQQGLSRIINGSDSPYWLRYAFDSDNGPGALTYNSNEPVIYGRYHSDLTPFKINFKVVGTIDSYDNRLLLIDSNVANLILGYSTVRTLGAANTYFNEFQGVDYTHNKQSRPWTDELETYSFRKPQSEVLVELNNPQTLANLTYLKNLEDANNYQPLKWHTGKLSNIEEPIGLTSSVSFNARENLGQYALGLLYPLNLGLTTLIVNQTLLSTQKALINQIYILSISLGLLLIIAIVLTASLLIMLVGDVYIAQYLRFMILMRALGYSNRAIRIYAFGTVTIFAFIVWIIGTIIAWALIFGVIQAVANLGFAIPYGLSWWPPLVSFIIICFSFLGSLLVSSHKVRSGQVSSLMNETNE